MSGGHKQGVGAALLVAAAVALMSAPAQAAVTDLPVGRADGVVIKWKRSEMVVVFSKRAKSLYDRIAGRKIELACHKDERDGSTSSTGIFRAPRRGRTLHTWDRERGWDYCRVWIAERKVKRGNSTRYFPRRLIVTVPLSQEGAVKVDEQGKAVLLEGVLALASAGAWKPTPEGRYVTPPTLVEKIGGRLWRTPFWRARPPLVALTSPDDTPPPGSVGYFSDGADHGAAVTVSAAGRRLFLETDADDVVRTNVLQILEDVRYELESDF